MRITFISNFLNHHQIPLCEAFYSNLGEGFSFVQTKSMSNERKRMGWDVQNEKHPYLKCVDEDKSNYKKYIDLVNESDVVIYGAAPYKFVQQRIKNNKLTFFYTERLFKKGILRMFNPLFAKKVLNQFIIPSFKKNIYVLCASAYASYDFRRLFIFNNRTLKWGYFPEVKKFDLNDLKKIKSHDLIKILWVGRFLKLKHVEDAIKIAYRLKTEGYSFKLDIIGTGLRECYLRKLIIKKNVENVIKIHGAMTSENVRVYMERANIYLFTSDFNEGWGAVLNESMNSGCAVIASHAIGSVPYLIKNGNNGLIYENGNVDDLYKNVKKIINNKKLQEKLSENAYKTMSETWNASIAVERLVQISEKIIKKERCNLFSDGPCSIAEVISNNWFSR